MTRFNDKPVVRMQIRSILDPHDPAFLNWNGNVVADHIDEWLDRVGYRFEVDVTDTPAKGVVRADVQNLGELIQDHDPRDVADLVIMISGIMDAGDNGRLEDVFSIDNPDNALYREEYAQHTTIGQARVDMADREAKFWAYGW